jgi:hypothetical protein
VVVAELGDRRLRRVQGRGSSYLSSSEPTMLFGLGEAARTDRFVVRWPDGLREVFAGVEAPAGSGTVGRLRLVRGAGRPE